MHSDKNLQFLPLPEIFLIVHLMPQKLTLGFFGGNAPSALFSFCANTPWNLLKVGGLASITRVCCSWTQVGCSGRWGCGECWQCALYLRSRRPEWWDEGCHPSEPIGEQWMIIWTGQMRRKCMKYGACGEEGGQESLRGKIAQGKRMWPFKILYKNTELHRTCLGYGVKC